MRPRKDVANARCRRQVGGPCPFCTADAVVGPAFNSGTDWAWEFYQCGACDALWQEGQGMWPDQAGRCLFRVLRSGRKYPKGGAR